MNSQFLIEPKMCRTNYIVVLSFLYTFVDVGYKKCTKMCVSSIYYDWESTPRRGGGHEQVECDWEDECVPCN